MLECTLFEDDKLCSLEEVTGNPCTGGPTNGLLQF